MTHISYSPTGNTPFERLLGHNKTVLEKWCALENVLFNSTSFNQIFIEELRRTLAFINGCKYCMAKGLPAENLQDKKTALAIDFAKAILANKITEDYYAILKKDFTDKEISELCALICFLTASQKYGAALNLS